MKRLIAISLALLLVATPCVGTEPEEKTTIRRDQIWAYSMLGTKDIRELDAVREPSGITKHPTINKIIRLLNLRRKEGKNAGPCFVVEGTGKQALEKALGVFSDLTKDVEPEQEFSPDSDLNLVFYSSMSGRYVRILSVEQVQQIITVNYQFVTHFTGESTAHFALIPLGKLPEGRFHVRINQFPPVNVKNRAATPLANSERIVCHGSSFRIQKEEL